MKSGYMNRRHTDAFQLELLEPRVLFSADGVADVLVETPVESGPAQPAVEEVTTESAVVMAVQPGSDRNSIWDDAFRPFPPPPVEDVSADMGRLPTPLPVTLPTHALPQPTLNVELSDVALIVFVIEELQRMRANGLPPLPPYPGEVMVQGDVAFQASVVLDYRINVPLNNRPYLDITFPRIVPIPDNTPESSSVETTLFARLPDDSPTVFVVGTLSLRDFPVNRSEIGQPFRLLANPVFLARSLPPTEYDWIFDRPGLTTGRGLAEAPQPGVQQVLATDTSQKPGVALTAFRSLGLSRANPEAPDAEGDLKRRLQEWSETWRAARPEPEINLSALFFIFDAAISLPMPLDTPASSAAVAQP
jgi:hypothetical protein